MELIALPAVRKLSSLVVTVLGMNPGRMTLQGTNTYLVGSGSSRILIDTGAGKAEYLDHLKGALASAGVKRLSHVLLSHHHADHVGGLQDVLALAARMDPNGHAPQIWKHEKHPLAEALDNPSVLEGLSVGFLKEGMRFATEDASCTVRTIYAPGHTDDHCCFFLEEEQALFSGDAILGQGTAVITDLKSYLSTLRALQKGDAMFKVIHPAHGPPLDDPAAAFESRSAGLMKVAFVPGRETSTWRR